MKLITKEIEKAFEKQGDTRDMHPNEIKIVCKFFMPDANATWHVYDRDRGNPDILWAFCNLGDDVMAEAGAVSLSELEALRGHMGLPVERDRSYPILRHTLNEVFEEVKGHPLMTADEWKAIGEKSDADKVLDEMPLLPLLDAYLEANGVDAGRSIDEMATSDELDAVIGVWNLLKRLSKENGGKHIAMSY